MYTHTHMRLDQRNPTLYIRMCVCVKCEVVTSFKMSLLAPLRTMVQAFGSLHSTRYTKYSSPCFLTSNRPHLVPTSLSFSSSVL